MEYEIRDVPGWEGYYRVSNRGEVFSVDRFVAGQCGPRFAKGRILKTMGDHHGYPSVSLMRQGSRWCVKVHVLVTLAFIGPRPKGMVTRHLDGDPLNNNLSNLSYGTPGQNGQDMVRHDRSNRGERCPHHKLKEPAVAMIKSMILDGIRLSDISSKCGVHEKTIRDIAECKTWKHVTWPIAI